MIRGCVVAEMLTLADPHVALSSTGWAIVDSSAFRTYPLVVLVVLLATRCCPRFLHVRSKSY